MRTKVISKILTISVLVALCTVAALAQAKKGQSQSPSTGKQEMPHDHAKMMDMKSEPHHMLAMAYHKNLATFAKALHEQAMQASPVNVEFARAAVTEMRRSFDQMKQHHQEHMQTMNAEMKTKMDGMMKEMETHQTELNTQLTSLEQEVNSATPDAKKISSLAASIHSHLEGMSKMQHDSKGDKMKMKMKM